MTMILLGGVFLILVMNIEGVLLGPQTKLLKQDCSRWPARDTTMIFLGKFNKTFGDIRKKLSNDSNIHFATADQINLYGMVQCRNYLSSKDCVSCLDAAWTQIRRACPNDDGGHVVYEGCFLRSSSQIYTLIICLFIHQPENTYGKEKS